MNFDDAPNAYQSFEGCKTQVATIYSFFSSSGWLFKPEKSQDPLLVNKTRWVALMIQLGKFVGGGGGVVGWWLTPTTYIQLAGAGSIMLLTISL